MAMAGHLQDMQVQPAQTEAPLTVVAVGALEVDASGFELRRDVPGATAFVGKNGKGL